MRSPRELVSSCASTACACRFLCTFDVLRLEATHSHGMPKCMCAYACPCCLCRLEGTYAYGMRMSLRRGWEPVGAFVLLLLSLSFQLILAYPLAGIKVPVQRYSGASSSS